MLPEPMMATLGAFLMADLACWTSGSSRLLVRGLTPSQVAAAMAQDSVPLSDTGFGQRYSASAAIGAEALITSWVC